MCIEEKLSIKTMEKELVKTRALFPTLTTGNRNGARIVDPFLKTFNSKTV